jgi:hypothetical protein
MCFFVLVAGLHTLPLIPRSLYLRHWSWMVWIIMDALCEWTQLVILVVVVEVVVVVAVGEEDMVVVVDAVVGLVDAVVVVEVIMVSCLHCF